MDTINFAIVDDDKDSIDIISASLGEVFKAKGYTCNIYKYTSPKAFLSNLSVHPVDILFCDIEMPELDGISLCKQIPSEKRPVLIFISNREDKVFEALQLHPFGFIRKKNFLIDVNNVINNYFVTMVNNNKYSLIVKSDTGDKITVDIDKIMYIESDLKQQLLHLLNVDKPIVIEMTMTHLDEALEKHGFIRCHKAYIVNYLYIYSILNDTVKLKNGESIFMSRRKSKEVKEKYLELVKQKGQFIY